MKWPAWLYRLDDARDPWWAHDKEAHLFGAAYATAVCGDGVALLAIVAVEALEVTLWLSLSVQRRMLIDDGKATWPPLHDRVSIKDVLWGMAGLILNRLVRRLCSALASS